MPESINTVECEPPLEDTSSTSDNKEDGSNVVFLSLNNEIGNLANISFDEPSQANTSTGMLVQE